MLELLYILRKMIEAYQKAIADIKVELRQKIANPPAGSDYECGRVDAFNEVLNLIDEHIGSDKE